MDSEINKMCQQKITTVMLALAKAQLMVDISRLTSTDYLAMAPGQ
jgi:hypothetical protein